MSRHSPRRLSLLVAALVMGVLVMTQVPGVRPSAQQAVAQSTAPSDSGGQDDGWRSVGQAQAQSPARGANENGAEPATPNTGEATDDTANLPTLVDLFMFSPYINGALLGLSAIALALFLFFVVTINHRTMVPSRFLEEVTKLIVRGKIEAAGDLCRAHRKVFVASVLQRLTENHEHDTAVLMDILDTEGRRRADLIWNRISFLADISNVAPMLGLLGTVLGMVKAFFTLDMDAAGVAGSQLATGVGEAMATTLFGLGVAIVATVFYSYLKARVTRVLADAEQAVHTVADIMHREEVDSGTRRRARSVGSAPPPPAPRRRSTDTSPRTNPGGQA